MLAFINDYKTKELLLSAERQFKKGIIIMSRTKRTFHQNSKQN